MNYRLANGKPLTWVDREKYKIAEELGLMDVLLQDGWGGLTAQQSGRIGGILGKRLHNEERDIGCLRKTGIDL